VFAPSTAEAVRCTGGWLFDQVMAGWDVTVVTDDLSDPRPLHILGARVRDLNSVPDTPAIGQCLRAVAVRADLYESDKRVRQMVRTALDQGQAEVRFWGDHWPDGFRRTTGPVSHELSLAARAFKAQAMAAAAMTVADVTAADLGSYVEVFRRGEIGRSALAGAGDGAR
jgi:hypothetical protein